MLDFAGKIIPGTHGRVETAPPQLQTTRSKFAGVRGESEIRLQHGGRPLECELWLHDASFSTAAAVVGKLDEFDDLVGTHGDLVETGTIVRLFLACTFEGATPLSDVLPIAGVGLTGSYFVIVRLRWWNLFSSLSF